MDRDRIKLIADEARAGFRFGPEVVAELCDELLALRGGPIIPFKDAAWMARIAKMMEGGEPK